MRTLDCRDMPCPKPVVLVQKTIEELPEDAAITVIVNSEMSCDNVVTFAQNKGFFVKTEHRGASLSFITIAKEFLCDIDKHITREKEITNKAIILTHDTIGTGIHGRILMQEFLDSMLSQKMLPSKLILINQAVKLACLDADTPTAKTMHLIEERGVKICSVLSSLKEFELHKKHHIGKTISMFELQETMLNYTTSTL